MSQPNMNEDLNIVANSNLEITLLDGDLNIIQALDDEPNDVGGLTSAELKAKFDEGPNKIKTYINETLIPEILTEEATEADRAAAEAVREANEEQRIENENARIAAEQARVDETNGIVAQANQAAQSWAVGGTGTREGEDTNNAKYWSEQAEAAAGGGVTSFKGRTGSVTPASGDYTAEMVGAYSKEETDTLLQKKADKSVAFTVTLTAAGWADNVQTISNEKFVHVGYAYTVAPASDSFADYADAMVYADDVTADGHMVFHCDSAPTADLTVNIVRMVTAE